MLLKCFCPCCGIVTSVAARRVLRKKPSKQLAHHWTEVPASRSCQMTRSSLQPEAETASSDEVQTHGVVADKAQIEAVTLAVAATTTGTMITTGVVVGVKQITTATAADTAAVQAAMMTAVPTATDVEESGGGVKQTKTRIKSLVSVIAVMASVGNEAVGTRHPKPAPRGNRLHELIAVLGTTLRFTFLLLLSWNLLHTCLSRRPTNYELHPCIFLVFG